MPRMKALVAQKFGGHRVEPGEIIDATDHESKLLLALRRAEVVPMPSTIEVKTVAVRAPRAKRDPNQPKRAYKRRDMRAEG